MILCQSFNVAGETAAMIRLSESPWKTSRELIKKYKLDKTFDFSKVRKLESCEELYYDADVFSLLKYKLIYTKPVEDYIPINKVFGLLDISRDTLRERLKKDLYIHIRFFEYKEVRYFSVIDFSTYKGYTPKLLQRDFDEFKISKKYRVSDETVLNTLPKFTEEPKKVSSKKFGLDELISIGIIRGVFEEKHRDAIKKALSGISNK